ncbi:MAG: glutamate--tRNA ligase, partial [Desulfocapsaceae bacterium]|nr:glutamate--tRNA ligase [Desulfocapsaceae bacterium]
ELIEAFTLERINKSNSIFNYRKGDEKFFTDPKAIAINEQYLRTMDIGEIGDMVQKVLEKESLWNAAYADVKKDWYLHTLALIRDRFHTLNDFATLGRAYFADDFQVEQKPLEKNLLKFPDLKEWLPILADRYQSLQQFTAEETERVAKELAEEKGVKPGVIVNGMRTVVTGQLAGPSMYDILMTLGRDKVVQRLRNVNRFFQQAD